ncbi:MAG: CinA family protein [Bacilli bacterium]|nr:CinA family protein [Bacilli bacterium]
MTAERINQIFREKGLSLGSVESFTGGSFASEITSVSGASHFFKGAYVTYATEEKHRLLGISWDTIDKYGVVSQEVAGEMAGHGKFLLNVDVCVSFTGNAGPEAMENKPVGEIYIGIAFRDMVQVFAYNLNGSRKEIQKQAINIAYEILEKILVKN